MPEIDVSHMLARLERMKLLTDVQTICQELHVDIELMLSGTRTPSVVRARHACSVKLRSYGLSFPEIAKALGCDHTTVMYAVRRAEGRPMPKDKRRPNGTP